jgi:hypothetical protein
MLDAAVASARVRLREHVFTIDAWQDSLPYALLSHEPDGGGLCSGPHWGV